MSNNNQIQITKQGLKNLEKELDKLVNVKRPKLVERLSNARAEGDLSENSDYQAARDELEFLDGRIAELDDVLKKAVIVSVNRNSGRVSFGTEVTLKVNGGKQKFEIVGEWEADPTEKKISHNSPLGKALIGKKVGDEVEVNAPVGKIKYQIIKIS